MAASPGFARPVDTEVSASPCIDSLAKAVVRFDVLACKFPTGFDARKNQDSKQVAEQVKLLSESLRLSILLERGSEETAELGTQLLLSMRQLHLLGKKGRLHPSHQTVLRLGLGLVEQIVKGLRELNPATEFSKP